MTPAETHEEKGTKLMLPRPFHPALAELPLKHATRCLVAAIHMNFRRYVFQSKESQDTVSEQFQVSPKKLYEALTGKHYDPGHKFKKAEKLAKEVEKVTSTTPTTGDKTKKSIEMDVDDEDPTKDKDQDEPAVLKKLSCKGSGKKMKLTLCCVQSTNSAMQLMTVGKIEAA